MMALLATAICAETKFMDESTQQKVTNIRHLMKRAYPETHKMASTSKEYATYIQQRPRPYTVVFFFYDTKSEDQVEEYQQFTLAARQFFDNNAHMTRKIGGKLHKPLFLFGMPYNDVEGDKDYINSIGAGGAAGIIISTGEEIGLAVDDLLLYNRKYLWKIQYSDGIITAKKIVEYIKEKTGVQIKYREPVSTFIYSFGIIFVALIVFGFIYQKFFWLLTDVRVWLLIFFAGHYISTSALVWTILNHPKWTGIKDEQTEWIFPSMALQHKAEGFMMGGLICSIPLLIGLLMYLNHKIQSAIIRRLLSYILLAAICYLFYTLEDMIKKKRHYELNLTPFNWFRRGSLRSDQGHYL